MRSESASAQLLTSFLNQAVLIFTHNKPMNECPCCANQLLRHVRHNHAYWFCPHCWQEMPNLSAASVQSARSPAYGLGLNSRLQKQLLAASH